MGSSADKDGVLQAPEALGDSAPIEGASMDGAVKDLEFAEEDFEIFPVDERIIVREGLEDFTNKYSFAVRVKTLIPEDGLRRCSGAIISPHLVLTAAHCVCLDGKASSEKRSSLFSSIVCAETATVTTAIYDSSQGVMENLMGGQYEELEGRIRAHPDFKRSSDNPAGLSHTADLALIVLDKPVPSRFRPVRLASGEPRPGETLTLVGYGQDETSGLIMGVRHFGKKKITGSNHEGILLEQRGLAALSSGGGTSCLHETTRDTVVLAGLISGYSGENPACTSVYYYRDWLLSEIQQTASFKKEPTP